MDECTSTLCILLITSICIIPASHSLPESTTLRNLEKRLGAVENDIKSINKAMKRLVYALLEAKDYEQGHILNRRDTADGSADKLLSELPISSLSGLRGPPGRDGRDGAPGTPGKDGSDGTPGIPGVPGKDGSDGIPGTIGLPGPLGPKGAIGAVGAPGATGDPGKDGVDGSPGVSGKDGGQGPPGVEGRIGPPSESLPGKFGAVYTRWGRTICGANSTIIYKGFAGGSNYDQPGGGVNCQCMPLDPQYNSFGGSGFDGSKIAGVEFQTSNYGIFPNSAYEQNVPCARCYTNNRSAVMMIPAKRECSDGWTKEYNGYLMTGYYNHNHQFTFECVDGNPEYVDGKSRDTHGALFYFTRIECSRGGHCPPYQSSREITCVVCSK